MEQNSKLLSTDWITDSIDTYIYSQRPKNSAIYIIVLAVVALIIISLPFIYVDITVQSNGIVRPNSEVSIITAPMTEIVERVYVKEGDMLKKGDEILKFRTNSSDGRIKYQQDRSLDLQTQISDLNLLSKRLSPSVFLSTARQQEYRKYLSEIHRLQTDLHQYEIDWKRHKTLFDKGLISESEYNEHYYQYLNRQNELNLQKANQKSTWKTDLANLKMQLSEMSSALIETNSNRNLHVVKSPINGTLEQFSGIYSGSYLQTGTTIAIVSPDTTLHVEVYVTPRDIAFITEGMRVKVQIESFNYNEWGTIDGYVKRISSDCIRDKNGNTFYEVRCKLTKNYLELRSQGRKGFIKKGMVCVAHFVVSRSSLLDLLYKNLDEWVNPTQHQTTTPINSHN